ncbi:ATP synthase F0 subunit B [bacterium]|nr:MAG: ATP synthase F0 subunit B [bacterium]
MNFIFGIILILLGISPVLNHEIHPVTGITLNFGETAAMIGMLLILFPIIKSFYTKPLSEAIESRTGELESTFTAAENLKADMANLRSEYEAKLAATEAQARETINAQLREAQSVRATLMAEANQKAEALVNNAQAEITSERVRLLSELRLHVTDLALSAAERVVGENMDNERNRRIVDDFIASSQMPAPLPPTTANVSPTPAGVSSQTIAPTISPSAL